MRKKKTLDMKFVKHAHRKAFYAYVREKGQAKLTLSHVYWYMYLRSGKGNVFHLADDLAAGDLGITVNSFRNTRNRLVREGWVMKHASSRVPDWVIQTTQELGTQELGTQELGTQELGTQELGTAVVVHLPYALNPNASPIPVPPTGFTSPEAIESEQNNNNSGGVVVVPPSPLDVAGYTPEAIAAQAEQCKNNPWVRQHDSLNARKREGYVRHLMTLDPPRAIRTGCSKCGKRVEADAEYCDKCMSLPHYRRESGQRTILKGDI